MAEEDPCPNNMHPISSVSTEQTADSTGPYIPISECITGVRAQDSQRAFTFDPKNIVTSTRTPLERVADHREHHIYTSQPQMRLHNIDLSENESNISDEECKSLTSSQSNIRDFSVAKSFTKLSINPKNNEVSEDGPPVPPRPPKTFALSKMYQANPIVDKAPETTHPQDAIYMHHARRMSQISVPPPSPVRALIVTKALVNAEEDEDHHNNQSMQYWNLSMPPAVDRALKPRASSYSISSSSSPCSGTTVLHFIPHVEIRPDALHYLDLDLKPQGPPSDINKKSQDIRRRVEISHGKSLSSADADSAYKTVDFLKTEAFNITRQDAEASRSNY